MRFSGSRRRADRCFALAGALMMAVAVPVPAVAQDEGQRQAIELDAESRRDLQLTLYQQDFGLVRDSRTADLSAGQNRLRISGVAKTLQPETVIVSGDFAVAAQSFLTDYLSESGLLEAHIGKAVGYVSRHPESGEETRVPATLLSVGPPPVVRVDGRVETLGPDHPARLVFDSVPPGMSARPRLELQVQAPSAGNREIGLSYLATGLGWTADYVLTIPAEDRQESLGAALRGLVTLSNGSGTAYRDAAVRLVAGEVSRTGGGPVRPQQRQQMMMAEAAMAPAADAAPAAAAAADRYVYELPRRVDVQDGERKQVILLDSPGVTAAREYRFENLQPSREPGVGPPAHAEIFVTAVNDGDAGLGDPLPAGVVRVYEDRESGPLFVGEDRIAHIPAGGDIRVSLGTSFDITAEHVQTEYVRISNSIFESAHEIVVSNAKERTVSVVVTQRLPAGATLLSESHPHETLAAGYWAWTLEIPAGGETTLTYRFRNR